MVINVYEANRKVIHQAATLEAAKAWLHANRNVSFYEADAGYPDCADALLVSGEVVCIQPDNFKIGS